jgi:hypothetical protein
MPTQLPPKTINKLGVFGVIRAAEVDDDLLPVGALTDTLNCSFDRKGAITLRPGTALIGAQVISGTQALGLYHFNSSVSGSSAIFLAINNAAGTATNIFRSTGEGFSISLGTLTVGSQVGFVTFANAAMFLNGQQQPWQTTDGVTWTNTGNPLAPNNAPITRWGEVFKSRIYLTGNTTNPSRLFFSSIIASSAVISWTTSTDFVDINPNDGENITGLRRYSLELLVFKPNYIYRFRTSSTDPDPLIKIGIRSNNSVVEGKLGLYFHHDTGFYRYSGGYPTEISRPISDIVDNIARSNYDYISAWKDSDHIYWSIGDITIEGVTVNRMVARYTESSDVWTLYNYPSEIRQGTTYTSGTAVIQMVGDRNGNVLRFNSGITDNGSGIPYQFITRWEDWNDTSYLKTINSISYVCEKAQGMELFYQTDEDVSWRSLGKVTKFWDIFNQLDIKCHRIRFRGRGVSSLEAFIFKKIKVERGLVEPIPGL